MPGRSERPVQPGLEGQRRFGLPRRRRGSPRARSPWSRCRATPSRPGGRWRQMARSLGEAGAEAWEARAERMRAAVEERFWMEPNGFYGLAIDGEGELCRPLASNPGHLLFVGLPSPARARRVVDRLLSEPVRQRLGPADPRHRRGALSIPCPTTTAPSGRTTRALALAGMARYGERAGVAKVLGDLFEAARNFDMRMPELLCGFSRAPDEPPIAYPVACLPQAWAAGSTFMMLQACLGLDDRRAPRERAGVVRPTLAAGAGPAGHRGLWRSASAEVDLRFQRIGESVAVTAGPRARDRGVSGGARGMRARRSGAVRATSRSRRPSSSRRTALFADLDGTLAPIEATPAGGRARCRATPAARALQTALGGRLAVISGRGLADLDRVLEGRTSALSRRFTAWSDGGPTARHRRARPPSADPRGRVEAFATSPARDPRLLVEDKGAAVALHYRRAPERWRRLPRAGGRDLAARWGWRSRRATWWSSLRAPGPDKGDAVAAFMREPPFAGFTAGLRRRRPDRRGRLSTPPRRWAALASWSARGGPTRGRSTRCRDVDAARAWLPAALRAAAA